VDLIDWDNGWNPNWLFKLFDVSTVEAICQILIGSINNADVPIWRPTTKGEFTVRSAYHLHKEILESNKGKCYRIEQQMLWK
jgi:hypothetical protein